MSIPDKIPSINRETSNTIMLVTDPYHDYNLNAVGFPDGTSIMSAIQRRYARTTIANPFPLTAGQTWAFHIYATPLHFQTNLSTGTLNGNTLAFSGSVDQGPLNIQYFKYDVGGALLQSSTVALGSPTPYKADNSAQVRTVSFGYELHNTTADINRSGSLTVYRSPSNFHDVDLWSKPSASVYQPFSAKFINSTPSTIEQATLYPNTRTWEASKGVYSVCLPSANNEYSRSIPSNFMLKTGGLDNGYAFMYFDHYETNVSIATFSPLCCTGVWSSKYSTDQTFTLDYRQILEILPTATDAVDLSFASTCKPIDRLFMKMYKQMYTEIPPGVPVSMNAAGDWVRGIVKIAKSIIPTLGAMPGIVGKIATIATPIVASIDNAIGKPNVSNRTVTTKQLKTALSQPPRKIKIREVKNKRHQQMKKH